MKTTFKNLSKVLLISITIFSISTLSSCNKDDETPAPTAQISPVQNPLNGFLVATGYNQETVPNTNDGSLYEFGISFRPLVNGKITSIVVKIPDVNPNLRVTIWDKSTGAILRTELVNVSSSGVEITKIISPFNLTTDKEYVITMNGNDYYRRKKTDGTPAIYPITVGDLKINSYAFRIGNEQIMPVESTSSSVLYSGDLSFTFQK